MVYRVWGWPLLHVVAAALCRHAVALQGGAISPTSPERSSYSGVQFAQADGVRTAWRHLGERHRAPAPAENRPHVQRSEANPGPPGDHVQARLSDQLLNNFIVIPEHNLLFCYIEKVGCANFNELFRRLRSRYDESQIEGTIWGKNSPRKHHLNREDLEQILANSSWHKAVFWRNPLERFISAFLSKCGGAHTDGQYHCKDQFHTANISFAAAVSAIAERDLEQLDRGEAIDDLNFNKHFRSMGHFCGGLRNTLQFYDTVEELETTTSHAKVAALLETIGVDANSIPGFNELFPTDTSPSSSSNSSTSETLEFEHEHNTLSNQHYSNLLPPDWPFLATILRRHYRSDYELFTGGRSYMPQQHLHGVKVQQRQDFQRQETKHVQKHAAQVPAQQWEHMRQ